MLYDNYPCLVESNNQQIKEVRSKTQPKTGKQTQVLRESEFGLRIAPSLLSHDRKMKMKMSIN